MENLIILKFPNCLQYTLYCLSTQALHVFSPVILKYQRIYSVSVKLLVSKHPVQPNTQFSKWKLRCFITPSVSLSWQKIKYFQNCTPDSCEVRIGKMHCHSKMLSVCQTANSEIAFSIIYLLLISYPSLIIQFKEVLAMSIALLFNYHGYSND